jgi:hypothetical protein
MARIARRLDHDAGKIDAGRPLALGRERGASRVHAREHIGKQVLWNWLVGHGRRLTQIRGRVKKPLMLD